MEVDVIAVEVLRAVEVVTVAVEVLCAVEVLRLAVEVFVISIDGGGCKKLTCILDGWCVGLVLIGCDAGGGGCTGNAGRWACLHMLSTVCCASPIRSKVGAIAVSVFVIVRGRVRLRLCMMADSVYTAAD